MKTLKITLLLLTLAIIAFAVYVTRPGDETWISDQSEISEAEIFDEMIDEAIVMSK